MRLNYTSTRHPGHDWTPPPFSAPWEPRAGRERISKKVDALRPRKHAPIKLRVAAQGRNGERHGVAHELVLLNGVQCKFARSFHPPGSQTIGATQSRPPQSSITCPYFPAAISVLKRTQMCVQKSPSLLMLHPCNLCRARDQLRPG